MPIKNVVVSYQCKFCLRTHGSWSRAKKCEDQGIVIPEFKSFEVVELTGITVGAKLSLIDGSEIRVKSGHKCTIRDEEDRDEGTPDLHEQPRAYWVFIGIPGKKPKMGSTVFSRKNLKKTIVEFGTLCPLCNCEAYPKFGKCFPSLGLSRRLPFMKHLQMHQCRTCHAEFFTTEQLKKVDEQLEEKMKGRKFRKA